jgi:4-diphosphocytidyl-2-C-methyl-D-erythritol kinase
MIEVFAPAKVNLVLRVMGKRPDGYHELAGVVQKVDLCDRLLLEEREGGEIAFACDREDLAGPDNLALRAARLLQERAGAARGASLRLEKRIPVGAGLGGGSSDAAAALEGLNRLWSMGLSRGELAALGATLGSDVPLFLHPGPVLMEGRGERITPCPWRIEACYLIVFPGFPVSTAWAYRNFRLTSPRAEDTIPRLLQAGKGGISPDIWGEILVNDLEEGVLPSHPAIGRLKSMLLEAGARASLMSGSGSSVFGLFDDADLAKSVAGAVRALPGHQVFVAAPLFG